MRHEAITKIKSCIFYCLLACSSIVSGQMYSFRNYGAESNIPNGFVYTINQSNDGYMWIGTGFGLSRFDGFDFYPVQYPDSVTGRIPSVSFRDKTGKLWFGCSDGSVFIAEGNKLTGLPLNNSRSITAIVDGPDGQVYVIPQGDVVFRVDPLHTGNIFKYSLPSDVVVFSACFNNNGKLLLGTRENILVFKVDKELLSQEGSVEGFDNSTVTSIFQLAGGQNFVAGTEGNGLFNLRMTESGGSVSRFINHPELNSISVQSITEDQDKSIWVSTFGSGVIQISLSGNSETISSLRYYNSKSGLGTNDVKTVLQDIEGNFWFGTYGKGVSMLASYAFSFYQPGSDASQNNIIYAGNSGINYILGTPAGFHIFDAASGRSLSFTNLIHQTANAEITSYFPDNAGNLWIGTAGSGLFVRNISGSVRKAYQSGDSGSDFIKDIIADARGVWLATSNGLLLLDKTGSTVIERFDINKGLPHNSINKLFSDRNGNICVATETDKMYWIDKDFNIIHGTGSMSGSTKNKLLSIAQDKEGNLWAATEGNGVFKCHNDSVTAITRSNDLFSNYCYGILSDSENEIWIGHDKGFSRYDAGKRIIRIYGSGFAHEGTCNPNAMFESSDKKIFIGTTQGVVVYDRAKDKNRNTAPLNNINYITVNDVRYDYTPSIILPYSRKYLVKVSFTGISFANPDKVYYSTFLENYDLGWTELNDSREVTYSLGDGKYKFNLISRTLDGLTRETPLSFEIIISHPVWKRWWFILLVIAAVIAILTFIVRQREKAQKKIQEYLEKELDERTSMIRQQKAEIETQNIEITDSINYAKRIQTSILPDIAKLKETFKDAYILFHPRDIVSGDFYWFDKLDEERFMIVCADSTGHGVPGAFMSMIGSTLLQDIVNRQKITKPSTILKMLDRQIFTTLNQNSELGVANDGMDMVICEVNIKTRHVLFASAMRPIIIVINGEPFYIRGNRLSVGGESLYEKFFDDQEYYLNEGDTLYFFSDGLPDQFGGTDGKKLKIARLKRLVEEISKLPMAEQDEAMSKFFLDWKGSFDQVDDVIFMGVRV